MIADEADQDGSKQFLVFAGVFFPSEEALNLHHGVAELRKKYGYLDGDSLKSSPMSRPKQVTAENHKDIKNSVLALAAEHECKICCYVVPHAIAKGQSHEDKLKFGANTLLLKFDQFLRENGKTPGVAFFDHTEDFNQSKYLREVFELGMPWQGDRKKLEYVIALDNTGVGHSHLCSITDIVVGAFRFVANEEDKDIVGKILTKSLEKIMWGIRDEKGVLKVKDRGICIRPKSITSTKHQADIEAFIDRIVGYRKA